MNNNEGKILAALDQLDRANDDLWTSTGLPRVEAIASLAGIDGLTRAQITNAAPEFTRDLVNHNEGGENNDGLENNDGKPESGDKELEGNDDKPLDEGETDNDQSSPQTQGLTGNQDFASSLAGDNAEVEKNEVEQNLQDAKEILNDALADLQAAQTAVVKAQNNMNAAETQFNRAFSSQRDMTSAHIQGYLGRQKEIREARIMQLKQNEEIRRSTGYDDTVRARSPIDEALGSRKVAWPLKKSGAGE